MRTGRPYKVGYDKNALFEGKVQSVQAPTQNEDLTNKGYVDQKVASIPAPDLSALATKQELQQGLEGKSDSYHNHPEYINFNEVDTLFTAYEKNGNKKTSINGNETSDVFYPTVKAVYDWVVGKLNGLAKLNEENEFVGKQIFFKTSSTYANPSTTIN